MADDLSCVDGAQRRAELGALLRDVFGSADPWRALREAAEAELAAHVAEFGEEEAFARYSLLLEGRARDIASAVMATSAWVDPDQRLAFLLSLLADARVAAAAVLPPQRVAVRSLLERLLPGSCSSCPGSEGSRT
jgi:hypothetical protein